MKETSPLSNSFKCATTHISKHKRVRHQVSGIETPCMFREQTAHSPPPPGRSSATARTVSHRLPPREEGASEREVSKCRACCRPPRPPSFARRPLSHRKAGSDGRRSLGRCCRRGSRRGGRRRRRECCKERKKELLLFFSPSGAAGVAAGVKLTAT